MFRFFRKASTPNNNAFSSAPQILTAIPPGIRRTGTLAVTGLGRLRFNGWAKCVPGTFFPPFVYELQRCGIDVVFVERMDALQALDPGPELVLAHIYSEEVARQDIPPAEADLSDATVIYNRTELGRILGHKPLTNRMLAAGGVAVPRMVSSGSGSSGRIFSNTADGTGNTAWLLDEADDMDASRYNTEFIDTRREVEGETYFTTVRAMCVGEQLVHAYVRARPVSDGSVSVHASNTPLDPWLIEHFQSVLVDARRAELESFCAAVGKVLGPGFFAHDLLLSSDDERFYICESGFKFNDEGYIKRLRAVGAHLPSHRLLFSPDYARAAATAFLRDCRSRGAFLDTPEFLDSRGRT